MNSNDLKALKEVFFEVEHLFDSEQRKTIVKNSSVLPSATNLNFKMFNYVVRVPYASLKYFFNRNAENNNIQQVYKMTEMTPIPVYFNIETGVMVNKYTSPEIYYERKFLNFESTDNIISTINKFNGSGIYLEEAFDVPGALALFRTMDLTSHENMLWLENFYKSAFIESDRLEPSHNDPDATNFTVTNQMIDFEYSGMAPQLSDISNFYSMYFHHTEVDGYIRTLDLGTEIQPLVIFWTFFWSMWRLSKDPELIKSNDYTRNAKRNLAFADELLSYYKNTLR